LIDFRGDIIDGLAGAFEKWDYVAFGTSDWQNLPREVEKAGLEPPVIHIPDSIDRNLEARREAEAVVKGLVSEYRTSTELERDLKVYFSDMDAERGMNLRDIIDRHADQWSLSRRCKGPSRRRN
jgi:hypothetical protein